MERMEIEERAIRKVELQKMTKNINRIIKEVQAEPELVVEEFVEPEPNTGDFRPIVEDPVMQYIFDMVFGRDEYQVC